MFSNEDPSSIKQRPGKREPSLAFTVLYLTQLLVDASFQDCLRANLTKDRWKMEAQNSRKQLRADLHSPQQCMLTLLVLTWSQAPFSP